MRSVMNLWPGGLGCEITLEVFGRRLCRGSLVRVWEFRRESSPMASLGQSPQTRLPEQKQQQPKRVITQGINDPDALAFDSQGNLYVANWFGNTVTVYSPAGDLIRTIQDGVYGPESIALDSKDSLYVADGAGGYGMTVTVYAPNSTKRLATIVSGHGPASLALNTTGELFVANADSNTETAYQHEGTRDYPLLFKIGNVGNPRNVLVDRSNNVYLLCCSNRNRYGDQEVIVYPPGSTKPLRTITDGVTGVHAIAFGPP
jgi:sugar lactone lactonase YvrE